jgi:hypothetical protein
MLLPDGGVVLRAGRAGVEGDHVELQALGDRRHKGVAELAVASHERVAHLPELALVAGAPGGAGSLERIRVEVEREVARHEPHLARVDVRGLELAEDLRREAVTELALQIGELHERDRGIGASKRVTAHVVQFHALILRRSWRGRGDALEGLPDRPEFLQHLLGLLGRDALGPGVPAGAEEQAGDDNPHARKTATSHKNLATILPRRV